MSASALLVSLWTDEVENYGGFDEKSLDRLSRHRVCHCDSSFGASLVSSGVRSEQTPHACRQADESPTGESTRLDLSRRKKRAREDCELGLGDSRPKRGQSQWLRP